MLVALAKLGSAEMVGQFSLGLAVTAPVITLSSLGLREAQATDARHEYLFGDYLGLRISMTALAFLVIFGIVIIVGYPAEVTMVILAVGLAKAFEAISDTFYGLFQRYERMDRVALSLVIKGPLSLVALSAGVYLTDSVFWGTMGMALTWALILLGCDAYNGWRIIKACQGTDNAPLTPYSRQQTLRPRWNPATLFRLAWLTLPLGLTGLLRSLETNIPRYFVEGQLGAAILGIFTALAYFDRAGGIVVSALGRSATPRLSHYYAAKNSTAFRSLLLKMAGMGLLLGGAGVLIAAVGGKELLTLFYRPEYARQDVFILLMAAAGMHYINQFIMCGPTAARRFRVQLVLYSIIAVVLVLLCSVLIPAQGLIGAALALLITRCIEFVGVLAITLYVQLMLRGRVSGRS
ncbi:MAG: hypothetical protein Kow00124_09130 [Anaerolineae bacterium]